MSTDEERTAATDVSPKDEPGTPRLVLFLDGIATSFDLAHATTIGRSRECEVRIEHGSVSRKHATIRMGSSLTIEDLGSANGTRIGDVPVGSDPVPLPLGCVFEVGSVRGIVALPPRSTPAVARVRELVETVAKGSISVLLTGETGAGKEVTARAIHDRSPRKDAPFIAINCAALPENLLESELFGYEKGAFTGAMSSKKGLLEAASGGTLLLDEIGDMPMATQAKILRVLETREVLPLGSVKERPIDVRFISATNRDLQRMVADGDFREDLLFRISGMTIDVPPLRERSSEVRQIATAILRSHDPRRTFTPAALVLLESHRWPGNIRELRSVIERAVLVARGDTIGEGDIVVKGSLEGAALPSGGERHRIEAVLERVGGNQTEAAKILGISRRTLGQRLDELGIKRPRKK